MCSCFFGRDAGAAAGIAAMPYVKPFMRKRIKMLKKTMHGVACKFS